MRVARTFAPAILASTHSLLASLRHPACARHQGRLHGIGNPSRPIAMPPCPPTPYPASASWAAVIVAAMSASVWVAEMKSASYWLHGRYTPRSIIAQKNAA